MFTLSTSVIHVWLWFVFPSMRYAYGSSPYIVPSVHTTLPDWASRFDADTPPGFPGVPWTKTEKKLNWKNITYVLECHLWLLKTQDTTFIERGVPIIFFTFWSRIDCSNCWIDDTFIFSCFRIRYITYFKITFSSTSWVLIVVTRPFRVLVNDSFEPRAWAN